MNFTKTFILLFIPGLYLNLKLCHSPYILWLKRTDLKKNFDQNNSTDIVGNINEYKYMNEYI